MLFLHLLSALESECKDTKYFQYGEKIMFVWRVRLLAHRARKTVWHWVSMRRERVSTRRRNR